MHLFGGHDDKAKFQNVAIGAGLFRELAGELANKRYAEQLLLQSLLNPAITALRNHREILQQWVKPFRQIAAARDIKHEVVEQGWQESLSRKGRRGRRKSIGREAVLRNVQSQKALIIEAMGRPDIDRARRIIDQLVGYQLENGERVYAVKSLCDLAIEAKVLGIYSLQLELTKQATDLVPDDAWAWAQYGDALLKGQQLPEALKAYEQAEGFGAGAVAKNGRAETLRALGRLTEALAAYDEVVAEHPENEVARNGLSCILVALRRYDEALQHLPTEHLTTLQQWIGYHIRGMIFLRTGKFKEAVKVFQHGISENPWPASREYFRTALAVAFLRRRDFIEAGHLLDEVTAPLLQPQANLLRLHASGGSGDTARAVTAYQNLANKPWYIPDELVEELHRQHILKEEPRYSDDWIFDQEDSVNLLVANQQSSTSSSFSTSY